MSKHVAPTITIELKRFINPDRFGIHTLTPTTDLWNLYPLGTDQPRYKHESVLVSEQSMVETRNGLSGSGHQRLAWEETPEYLRAYFIDNEAPLEWKTGLREGDPNFTSVVTFWVKGTLPTTILGQTLIELRKASFEKRRLAAIENGEES